MDKKYLGDSYDAVKRMWQEILAPKAPLFAAARFIPEDIRATYTKITRIPILVEKSMLYSILNDPDTGIRLPNYIAKLSVHKKHITIEEIERQLADEKVFCSITFDQSHHRNNGIPLKDQRSKKLQALRDLNVEAFYFRSHASFLFASRIISEVEKLVLDAGIPSERIQKL